LQQNKHFIVAIISKKFVQRMIIISVAISRYDSRQAYETVKASFLAADFALSISHQKKLAISRCLFSSAKKANEIL